MDHNSRLMKMIDKVLSDSRLSEIISAETYFENDVGMEIDNIFSDNARESLAKYIIARALSTRYIKKMNDCGQAISLSDFMQYGIDYLECTDYSGKVTKHKTRMQAISERIERVSLLDSLFISDPGQFEKKWYNIVPVFATYQFLLLYLISEAPYVRISVGECLEKRKTDKLEELKPLKGRFQRLNFEYDVDGLNVFGYVKRKRSVHIEVLDKVLKEVREIESSIIPIRSPHEKTKIPKKLAGYAKTIYDLWHDLEKYLEEEITFAKDAEEAKKLYKEETRGEYLSKWKQLNKRRVDQVRRCLNDKSNIKYLLEILTYNKNDLSTSGDLNGDLICKFAGDYYLLLSIIKNDMLSGLGNGPAEENKEVKAQKAFNAEFFMDLQKETFYLSYYFIEQMYPIGMTAFLIDEFGEFSDLGKKSEEKILNALSKIILIPDVFSRELYLRIVINIYRKYAIVKNREYPVREEIRPTLYLMKVVEDFDLDLWIDDVSEYFQHLAFNFYPILDAICDEVFANEYDISTDDLAVAFQNISETHDAWAPEIFQGNLEMIRKNKALSVDIFQNYYEILYNKRSFANRDMLLKNIIQLYNSESGISPYVQTVSKKAVRKYLRELDDLKRLKR